MVILLKLQKLWTGLKNEMMFESQKVIQEWLESGDVLILLNSVVFLILSIFNS